MSSTVATAAVAAPAAADAQKTFPYKRALHVWARFTSCEISLGHAMHDIKNNHFGILADTKDKPLARAELLEEFLPPSEGTILFYEILAAHINHTLNLRQKFPGVQVSVDSIVEMAEICLPSGARPQAFEAIRDMIVQQNKCDAENGLESLEAYPYSASQAILHAAEKLFSDDEHVEKMVKHDLRRLFKLAIARAEKYPNKSEVLVQSLYTVENYANRYDLAGYRDEHMHVSSKASGTSRNPRLSVALVQAFNGNNLGPAMMIGSTPQYMNVHWQRYGAEDSFDPLAEHARDFILDVNRRGTHPQALILHPTLRSDMN